MTKKCVSAHPSSILTSLFLILDHYTLFMKLIYRLIIALMPIKIYNNSIVTTR